MTPEGKAPRGMTYFKDTVTRVVKHEGRVRFEVVTEAGELLVQIDYEPAHAVTVGEWLVALGRDQQKRPQPVGHLRLVGAKEGGV